MSDIPLLNNLQTLAFLETPDEYVDTQSQDFDFNDFSSQPDLDMSHYRRSDSYRVRASSSDVKIDSVA